jgi:hypothetical protein
VLVTVVSSAFVDVFIQDKNIHQAAFLSQSQIVLELIITRQVCRSYKQFFHRNSSI